MLYTRTPYKFTGLLYNMLPTSAHLKPKVKHRNLAMNWLLEQFPLAFNLGNRQPLQKNMLSDILAQNREDTPSEADLKAALSYYTNWGSYLNGLKAGKARIDLQGQPVGEVTLAEEEKAQAALEMARNQMSSK